MITTPVQSHNTSELRRAELIEESFVRPVSIRGKAGRRMLMVPQDTVDRNNEINRYAQLISRVLIECQRSDPSTAVLGEVAYIRDWSPDRQAQFLRGFAEALVAAVADNDPTIVSTYIEVMSHADDPLLPQFDSGRGTQVDRDRVEAHMAARTRR